MTADDEAPVEAREGAKREKMPPGVYRHHSRLWLSYYVTGPDGRRFAGGPTRPDTMEVTLETNIPGVYRVEWTTVSTLDGHILEVNDALGRIFGYEREELLQQSSYALYFGAEERHWLMARLRDQSAKRDPLAGLSGQERRILELIGEGLTNRQIGEQMFLAEKTVKNYVSALFAKLGMERRTQAAAYATRVFGDQHDEHESHYGPGN